MPPAKAYPVKTQICPCRSLYISLQIGQTTCKVGHCTVYTLFSHCSSARVFCQLFNTREKLPPNYRTRATDKSVFKMFIIQFVYGVGKANMILHLMYFPLGLSCCSPHIMVSLVALTSSVSEKRKTKKTRERKTKYCLGAL